MFCTHTLLCRFIYWTYSCIVGGGAPLMWALHRIDLRSQSTCKWIVMVTLLCVCVCLNPLKTLSRISHIIIYTYALAAWCAFNTYMILLHSRNVYRCETWRYIVSLMFYHTIPTYMTIDVVHTKSIRWWIWWIWRTCGADAKKKMIIKA